MSWYLFSLYDTFFLSFSLGFTTIDDSCICVHSFPWTRNFWEEWQQISNEPVSERHSFSLVLSFSLSCSYCFSLSISTFLSLSYTGKKILRLCITQEFIHVERETEESEKEGERKIFREEKCQTCPHPFMWKLVTREKRLSGVRKTHFHFFSTLLFSGSPHIFKFECVGRREREQKRNVFHFSLKHNSVSLSFLFSFSPSYLFLSLLSVSFSIHLLIQVKDRNE